MWDGTLLPHSGQSLKTGADQRLAPRRFFCRLLEVRRFGTAMMKCVLGLVLEVLEGVEGGPAVVAFGAGRGA